MKPRYAHDLKVDEIIQKLNRFKLNKTKTKIKKKKLPFSNTMHSKKEGSLRELLGLENLNEIVEINKQEMFAYVEPSVPMDHLFNALSEVNMRVEVMPEFKGITVGGAINGSAIESSSFLFGQFNNCCLAYEVLLGNGKLVQASKDENADLFYAISGSYGTFGIITLVKISLTPFFPYILLKYKKFDTIQEAFLNLNKDVKEENGADFIEGLVFDSNKILLIEGYLKGEESASKIPKKLSLKPLSPWFYQHALEKMHREDFEPEKISTEEYIFRHDRGAFWMGAYGSNLKLFLRYYLESRFGLKSLSLKLLGPLKKGIKLKPLKGASNFLFQLLISWWMTSRKLYKMLHKGSENWFQKHFIIQDFYIPKENAEKFLTNAIEETKIFPIWLCPVKGTRNPEIFSPHAENEEKQFIDIGLYGMAEDVEKTGSINRYLENLTKALNGKKMLYSFNSYSKKDFFEIYPKDTYEALRKKYHAEGIFSPIEDKIL